MSSKFRDLSKLQLTRLAAILKMEAVTTKLLPDGVSYKSVNALYHAGLLNRTLVPNPMHGKGNRKEPKQIYSYTVKAGVAAFLKDETLATSAPAPTATPASPQAKTRREELEAELHGLKKRAKEVQDALDEEAVKSYLDGLNLHFAGATPEQIAKTLLRAGGADPNFARGLTRYREMADATTAGISVTAARATAPQARA